ncbi:hypothetical protein D3Z36_09810 [Lachnospiraceae bacterium]|nr:hypothetical protein [Lachnospiraceae bacterium]
MRYFRRKAAGMLSIIFSFCVLLSPDRVKAANQDVGRQRIWITVGEQDFSAELYDNTAAEAWLEQMPMTLEMNELNSNEKYYYFSESLPTNPERPSAIHTGDLMLYGQSCLVLFYKDFETSYSYTPLGRMEDATGLAEALGGGNVTVSFRLDEESSVDVKEELRKLYGEANAILEKGYTAESWKVFKYALGLAEDTLENQNTVSENVQTAIKCLKDAKMGLVTLESVLEKEISNCSKADSDGYTVESFNIYQNALRDAKMLKLAGGYTEDRMNQTIAALRMAYENLELQNSEQQPEEPGKQPEEKPSEQPPDLAERQPDQNTIEVRTLKLTGNVARLAKGKSVKLKAVVSPVDALDKRLKWTSSNKKVATVTADGIVTGRKKGTATITAKARDGSGVKGRYKITVMPHTVKKIALKSRTKTLVTGKKVKVHAVVSVTGKEANKKLDWSVSNKKYATVNSRGQVTAKKTGIGKIVLITAKATDGSKKKASIRFRIRASK